MKTLLIWALAIGGGAAVGALGGTAWLVYQGAVVETPDLVSDSLEGETGDVGEGREDDPALEVDPAVPALLDEFGLEGAPETQSRPGGALDATEGAEAAAVNDPGNSPPSDAARGGNEATPNANHARLGRIFAAMRPPEAAAVLAQLDDAEISGILMTIPARNAAPILAELDPERAASLSRRVLGERAP